MLAMCDRYGRVFASIPGLAKRAKVSLKNTETALSLFLSPDKYSRTKDYEGRRIAEISGGWKLLNHAMYRELRDEEDRKTYKREWIASKRAESKSVDRRVDNSRQKSTHTDADADKKNNIAHLQCAARFSEFWSAYPKKRNKAKAEQAWKRKHLDDKADLIIADVKTRTVSDPQWLKPDYEFVPYPTTYLNGARWEDETPADNDWLENLQ